MRKTIFISHATPDDNDFTKWLALKLVALGYEVWCDILFLGKGVDFWNDIEKEIRENTCKFLAVSSLASNQRPGVLKELAVAEKVKKQLQDNRFIIPLAIDEKLSYDDINIEIVRLNAIDFKKSWASGLQDLLDAFEKQNVPRDTPNPDKSNQIYQQINLYDKGVIEKEEIYDSNWFSILSFPEELRFHEFGGYRIPDRFDLNRLSYPAIRYKNYLCTFAWEYDFISQLPKTETYESSRTIRFQTKDVLSNTFHSDFISRQSAQRLIVQLLNRAFELKMRAKSLREYPMSNTTGYWIEKGTLEKDKFNNTLLVGKQLNKTWHFGISGAGKLYPFPVLMISSHIYFTENGVSLIDQASIQHAARRRQGKNWWNDTWRKKLLAFVGYLTDDEGSIYLDVGSEEKIHISNRPLQFHSTFSYVPPEKSVLVEEAEIADIGSLDINETEGGETQGQ